MFKMISARLKAVKIATYAVDGAIGILPVVSVVAACIIVLSENLEWDLTSTGFSIFLKVFEFPINCMVATVAISILRLTLQSVDEARKSADATGAQSELSYRAILHAEYGRYITHILSYKPEGFKEFSNQMQEFECLDAARVFDRVVARAWSKPIPSITVMEELNKIYDSYNVLVLQVGSGMADWLSGFVDLVSNVIKFRQDKLLIRSPRIEQKEKRIYLVPVAYLSATPKCLTCVRMDLELPGCTSLRDIFFTLEDDLKYIFSALYYFDFLHEHIRTLGFIKVSMDRFSDRLEKKSDFYDLDIKILWASNHKAAGLNFHLDRLVRPVA